jgi:hypothetical protein
MVVSEVARNSNVIPGKLAIAGATLTRRLKEIWISAFAVVTPGAF